jgi:alpha-beta hydrolase superfamily lysophospholipase
MVSLASGISVILLGILARLWPDITMLVIALLIGPVGVILGLGQLLRGIRTSRDHRSWRTSHPQSSRGRVLAVGRATLSLLLALALSGVSADPHDESPSISAFYHAPDDLPGTPGQLIRSDPFDRGLPEDAHAVRILYTTIALNGTIGVASGLVVIPDRQPDTPFPVLLWEHGTTGIAQQCAPSLLADPLGAGAMPARQAVIDNGWVIVAPDYLGLGTGGPHPYLIGVPTATSSLDAVRAARQIKDLSLGSNTVVWGHSQGGAAALWAGIEVASYAPDVPLLGIAALAPASNPLGLAEYAQNTPVFELFGLFTLVAYSEVYPDVRLDDYLRPSSRTVVNAVVSRCLSEPATFLSLGALMSGQTLFSRDPATGALATRLQENTPHTPSGIPTFIGQGATDTLINPELQTAFVAGLCDQSQPVDYRIYAGRDHLGIVADSSPMLPDLLSWTLDRFAGVPAPATCSTPGD